MKTLADLLAEPGQDAAGRPAGISRGPASIPDASLMLADASSKAGQLASASIPDASYAGKSLSASILDASLEEHDASSDDKTRESRRRGGLIRASSMTVEERRALAQRAAQARWGKRRPIGFTPTDSNYFQHD
jgi:hypothetical protein